MELGPIVHTAVLLGLFDSDAFRFGVDNRWRGVADPLNGPLLLMILATVFTLAIFRSRSLLLGMGRGKVWIFLGAWTVASIIWSVSPIDSSLSAITIMSVILAVCYLGAALDYRAVSKVICVALIGLCAVALMFGLLWPHYGLMTASKFNGLLCGFYDHKNILAGNVFVLLSWTMAAGTAGFLPKRLAQLGIALGITTVVWAGSSTVLAGTALVLLSISAVGLAARLRLAVIVTTLALLVAAILGTLVLPYVLDLLFEILGKDRTLSWSDVLWASYIDLANQRPLTGYGFTATYSLGVFDSRLFTINGRIPSAHSAFIKMYVWLGAFAVIAYLSANIRLVAKVIRRISRKTNESYLMITMPIAYAMFSYTEAGGGLHFHNGLILLVLVYVLSSRIRSHASPINSGVTKR